MFKRYLCRTYVRFLSTGAVRYHSCFVHDLTGKTLPVKWALFRLTTVTAPRLVIALLSCSTYMGVVSLNNTSHIGHATVAKLNRVPIKHFM